MAQKQVRRMDYSPDEIVRSQGGRGETFASLLERRISRRGLLKGSVVATGALVLSTAVRVDVDAGFVKPGVSSRYGHVAFQPIPKQPEDSQQIVLAAGHRWSPLLKWGDPIRFDGPEFDPWNQTAERQAQQVGYNCDYIGWHPLPFAADDSDRGLLLVNHEYTNAELMFANFDPDAKTREQVDIELEAHGATIIELQRDPATGRMTPNLLSPYNRRITGTTPIAISGPAAGHPWMCTSGDPEGRLVLGMLNNCAGGITPWGTILTCEENFQGYFGHLSNLSADDPRHAVHKRYGLSDAGGYAWEEHYGRFSIGAEPNEAFRFGWVVEIDPYHPDSQPVKRTALGRFRHEGATFGWSPSGHVVFYSGDDARFEYIYKYVSNQVWDPMKYGMNQGLLDDGVLYVAKFNDDGTGEWLPLVYGVGPLTSDNGFTSQGDVLIRTRIAADVLGATKMDRPEDIQQNPISKKVFAALTNNNQRGGTDRPPADPANPRVNNTSGHIIEISEDGDDAASTTFTWDIFLLCGDPSDESTYFAGFPKEYVSPIAAPDNVNFDMDGNLWISTDGQPAPLGNADGLYCVPTEGPQRGYVAQFMAVVAGAECASFEFTRDNRNLFVSIQHPGESGTVEEPITMWPDGGPLVRPTVIQVWAEDGGRVGGGDVPPRWAR